jgi:hypothetical protein
MCHEKYHVDPDLRAVANRLSGLPLAKGDAQRERCMTVSQMLLDRAACEGLAYYLEAGLASIPSGEVHRILVRLSSIRARLAVDAITMLEKEQAEDEVPF